MTPEQANLAMRFLERVELKGAEVPAFTHVMAGLSNIAKSDDDLKDTLPPQGATNEGDE